MAEIFLLVLLYFQIYDEAVYTETKHHSYEYLVYYLLNLHYDSNLSSTIHLESTNFVIEASKFHWIKPATENNNFVGLYETINEQMFASWIAHIDETNNKCDIKTIIVAACNPRKLFAECYRSNPSSRCNKPNQYSIKINDWVGEVYECHSMEFENVTNTIIKYKCEAFLYDDYNNTFKSHHDKFFEGVRLK